MKLFVIGIFFIHFIFVALFIMHGLQVEKRLDRIVELLEHIR